jgi:streptogramin lyase
MSAGPGGPAVGAEFAGHRIDAVIGEGGMGVVFRALNLALDRVRALKVIAPAMSADERFRERFRRESRLAASIEHPNVIPVHEAGEQDGCLYLSMRLVEGSDLRALVRAQGRLEPQGAARVVAAVASGLDVAHAAGLVHRDVKPANVLVGEGADAGRVYLTDFGISRTLEGGETVTTTGEVVGSADFIAPEQIAGDPVDHRADVYALGAIAHFALTGEPPFPRDSDLAKLFAHANAPRPRPSLVNPALPSGVDTAVARAMAVDPRDRFQSAGAFARAFGAALDGGETAPLGASAPRRRDGRRWPRPVWLALGAAAVAALAVAAVLIASNDGGDSEGAHPRLRASPGIDVGDSPTSVAVGDERVWMAARAAGQVEAVERATLKPSIRIPVPSPSQVAVGFGSVWAVSSNANAIYRLDPLENAAPLQIPLGEAARPVDVAVDERWVWVANAGSQDVVRIDPDTNRPAGDVNLGTAPRALATGDGAVWVTNFELGSVSRIDPDTVKRVGNAIPVGPTPNEIAAGEGAVWVTSNLEGTVTRIDPGANAVAGDPMPVGDLPRGIAAGLGYVWVALGGDDSVATIDPGSGEVVGEPIAVGEDVSDVALSNRDAWATSEGDSVVTRITPSP